MWRRDAFYKTITARLWIILLVVYVFELWLRLMIQHWLFLTGAFDLGLFSQSLWTTAHSEGFLFNTPEFIELGVKSHMGVHFQPVLFLLVPVYYLYPNPELLLTLVPIAMFVAGVIFYLFSRDALGGVEHSVYVILFFILCPFAWITDDFHPSVLAVPVIFAIVYFSHRILVMGDSSLSNKLGVLLLSILLLSTKEDAGIALVSIGVLFILVREKRSLWSILRNMTSIKGLREFCMAHQLEVDFVFVGIMSVIVETFVLVPMFNPTGHYPFLSGDVGKIYLDLDSFYLRAIYIIVWLGYFGIPLLKNPRFLIPPFIPLAEIIIMGSWRPVVAIGTHYSYILLPMSLVSSIYALRTLRSSKNSHLLKTMRFSLGMAMMIFLLVAPPINFSDYSRVWGTSSYTLSSVWDVWGGYMEILDKSLPVFYEADRRCALMVQGNIFPRLANRNTTYVVRTVFGDSYLQNNSIVIVDSLYGGLFNSSMRVINGRLRNGNYSNVQVIDLRQVVYRCSGRDPAVTPIRPEDSVVKCVTETFKHYIHRCESQLTEVSGNG